MIPIVATGCSGFSGCSGYLNVPITARETFHRRNGEPSEPLEPLHARFIAMFYKPYHRYRTLAYTRHLHVPPAMPSLQNLCMHVPSLCLSSHITATEPLHARAISMFLQPCYRYRTFACTCHLHVPPAMLSLQNPVTSHESPVTISSYSSSPFYPSYAFCSFSVS